MCNGWAKVTLQVTSKVTNPENDSEYEILTATRNNLVKRFYYFETEKLLYFASL